MLVPPSQGNRRTPSQGAPRGPESVVRISPGPYDNPQDFAARPAKRPQARIGKGLTCDRKANPSLARPVRTAKTDFPRLTAVATEGG
ncbi:MAG: hypothetical protein GIKADHBN_02497 [Phycisphaerales bacterium]|nr:hypothetical protein [Phycisphaerales bacterium]